MKFERLFQEGSIGGLKIRNRIVMAPCGTHFPKDGAVTDQMIAYYEARARGGAGAIVVEAAFPRREGYYKERLGIGNDKFIPGLNRLATAIQKHGAKAVIQLHAHRGRDDSEEPLTPWETRRAWKSGMHPGQKYTVPKVATREDLKKITADFGEGALRARRAGFDAVLIHGSHGYLICEFLSPLANRRNDEYGGSLENRARFALELCQETKAKAGRDYPVIYRLSASERLEGGFSIEDAVSFCKMLETAGIDAVDVVSGFADTYYWAVPSMRFPRGYNVPLAERIKGAIKIPVMVAGRINSPDLAEEILDQGKADFITLGRALIADPEFPKKAMEGYPGEIRRCIACNECLNPLVRAKKPYTTCAINPAVGEEHELQIVPASLRKKVLVIGGGPAGMEVAMVAALRGHSVVVWEKSDRLGGQLNLAVMPPHKEELGNLIEYFKMQLTKLGVTVELNRAATVSSVTKSGAEALVVATGSSASIPVIPGVEHNLVAARDVLSGKIEVGPEVLVLGGDLVSCEIAEFLVDKGKRVTIVETRAEIAGDAALWARWPLTDALSQKGVQMLTGASIQRSTPQGLEITDNDGKHRELRANNIVIATGASPNRKVLEALRGKGFELYEVGDCARPGRIWDAIHAGAAIGLKI